MTGHTILRAKAFKPRFTKRITAQEIFLVGRYPQSRLGSADIPVRSNLRIRAWHGFPASFARATLLRTGMSALVCLAGKQSSGMRVPDGRVGPTEADG